MVATDPDLRYLFRVREGVSVSSEDGVGETSESFSSASVLSHDSVMEIVPGVPCINEGDP